MVGASAQPALARDARVFDIKAGPLSDALVALGVQGGINIGLSSPTMLGTPVRAVHGRLTVDAALKRLLAGSGLHAVRIDDRSYTIAADRPKPRAAEASAPPATLTGSSDIIVTASKRDIRLRDFPGTIAMLDATRAGLNGTARYGTQAIVDNIPSLSSTHLGPGRNKLIIRGVADSSFTGPTPAIVGQYLGDIRLNYNAPDPDLNLYDMASVEVLEGPQGTLYGAGSLGGIVRLVPQKPDLTKIAGSLAAGYGKVEGGGPSDDLAAMINLPILDGALGLRAVAYRSIDGGYLRDATRGLSHINRSKTQGGRLALTAKLGDGWTIDLGATAQDINNADSQYAERGLPRYTRASAIAQPFDNDYRLGQIVVTKNWGSLALLSATGIVRHDVDERFDATPAGEPIPQAFHQDNHITLFSNENRLSRQRADGTGWLLGTSFISNSERLTRDLGPATAPVRIAGVRNSVTQMAVYGELGVGFGRFILTGGGRVARSRLTGELIDAGQDMAEPNRNETEILPSVALSWRPLARLTAYVRYQEGFRPGGLSVTAGDSGVVSQRFLGDSIVTLESGLRLGQPSDRFSASMSASFSHWEHIQADLVATTGLPYTANIGNGRIFGFEANARWAPSHRFAIEGGLFLNDSELTAPSTGFEDAAHAELPNVARIGARAGFVYTRPLNDRLTATLRGSVRYFGHSRLGVGDTLDIEQGNYADTALGLRIGTERIGVSIDATNMFDADANRFSLGNPFGVMDRRQITPQQPRSFRFGIDARF